MNYIECFNRSRAASCSPFFCFRSWCLDGARCGVFSVAPLRRSWCASMLPGVECCPLHHFRRSWCLNAARRGVLPVAPLRLSWCASMLPGVECCPLHHLRLSWCASMLPGVECCPLHRCAVPGASMLPGVECCPLHRCAVPGAPQCCQVWSVTRAPFAPVLVRPLRPLCYVIHIIVYHRY